MTCVAPLGAAVMWLIAVGVAFMLFVVLRVGVDAVRRRLLDWSFTAWKRNYVRAAREDEEKYPRNER